MASVVKRIASIILVCGLVEVLTLQTHAVFQLQKGELTQVIVIRSRGSEGGDENIPVAPPST